REAVALQLPQVALGGIERMRVDALLAERGDHAFARHQRDLALGGRAAHQHGDLAEFVAGGHWTPPGWDLAPPVRNAGDASAIAGSPRMRTSGSRSTPVFARTVSRTCAISASMSAARARRAGLTMKLACFIDTSAPPIAWPLRPQLSMSRAAWSPGGLRNTLPALGSDSGCVAMRLPSSALMSVRACAVSPNAKRNHAAVKTPSGALPSACCTLR